MRLEDTLAEGPQQVRLVAGYAAVLTDLVGVLALVEAVQSSLAFRVIDALENLSPALGQDRPKLPRPRVTLHTHRLNRRHVSIYKLQHGLQSVVRGRALINGLNRGSQVPSGPRARPG